MGTRRIRSFPRRGPRRPSAALLLPPPSPPGRPPPLSHTRQHPARRSSSTRTRMHTPPRSLSPRARRFCVRVGLRRFSLAFRRGSDFQRLRLSGRVSFSRIESPEPICRDRWAKRERVAFCFFGTGSNLLRHAGARHASSRELRRILSSALHRIQKYRPACYVMLESWMRSRVASRFRLVRHDISGNRDNDVNEEKD